MGTAGCYGCGGVPVPTPIPYAPTVAPYVAPVAPILPIAPPIIAPIRRPVFDADPITPGIQARPGVVTQVGAPRMIGGRPPIGIGYGAGFGGIDADPITPGIQARPGVVSPVGPPRALGGGIGAPRLGGYPGSGLGSGFSPYPSTYRF